VPPVRGCAHTAAEAVACPGLSAYAAAAIVLHAQIDERASDAEHDRTLLAAACRCTLVTASRRIMAMALSSGCGS